MTNRYDGSFEDTKRVSEAPTPIADEFRKRLLELRKDPDRPRIIVYDKEDYEREL